MTKDHTSPVPQPRGRFITFEGGEGAGKSTQVTLLLDRLRKRGIEAIATREPGGSPHAEELRNILLSGLVAPLGAEAEALVFSAARIDHLDQKIKPALKAGMFVVCDRFADSTRAYQGTLGKVDPAFIHALEAVAVGDTRPDLTIILDVPAEIGLQRASLRRADANADRFEGENLAFHQGLRQAFLDIAKQEPQRCIVIDATLPAEKISELIWADVERRFVTVDSQMKARS